VAAVLGGDLHTAIRKTEGRSDVDVEVLLHGAEKLGEVYPIPGAQERIANLRKRYGKVRTNLDVLEAQVQRQTRELERMNGRGLEDDAAGEEEEIEITDEDLAREEEEIRELERRKRQLEERVSGMERDLGGLLR
jgi:chromosome segregation ATPase